MPRSEGPTTQRSSDEAPARARRSSNPPRVTRTGVVSPAVAGSDRAAAVSGDREVLSIGRKLPGRYTISGRIGAGSMGTVYRAVQNGTGREVAIKVLHSKRFDADASARFTREARANSMLRSPHTVQVLDFGPGDDGELFLVMELLRGESLRQRLARLDRFPAEVAVSVARQALSSLAEAHQKGIVHRDLKPDHIFLAKDEQTGEEIVKVLDFGIAKMLGKDGHKFNAIETSEGHVLGTPRYMSPEQAQGKSLDARSDLYSFAVIIYEMLTGEPPFTSEEAVVVMANHINKRPMPPSARCPQANIPRALDALVMRGLSKNPAERPESAQVFSAALSLAQADEPGLEVDIADTHHTTLQILKPKPPLWARMAFGFSIGLGAAVGAAVLAARLRAPAQPIASAAAGSTASASVIAARPSALPAPTAAPSPAASAAPAVATSPSASAAPAEVPAAGASAEPEPSATPVVAPPPSVRPVVRPPVVPAKPKRPKYDYLE